MSKGRVLLVNPWIVDFAAYDFWIKPLGLLSIGGVLSENAYETVLLDCLDRNHPLLLRFQGLNQARSKSDGTGRFLKTYIEKPAVLESVPRRYARYGLPAELVDECLANLARPDAVLVTSGMTYWYPGVVEIIDMLKRRFPGVPVILGGIYATLCHSHAQETCGADRVVAGEGESEALRIVDDITGNRSEVDRYRAFDALPMPDYGLYDRLDSAAILTSRGCPHRCPFCASHLLSTGYRSRGTARVVDEIAALRRRAGVTEFALYDDALLFKKQDHLIPILEGVIAERLDVHFHTPNGIQPSEIDARIAGLMREAGFQTIWLSYETHDRNRQEEMGFKVCDEDMRMAVGHLLRAGFHGGQIGAYVLMGLPGQPVAEVIQSMCFVLGLGIKLSLASYSPIPGTQTWQAALEQGLVSESDDPLLSNNSIVPMWSSSFNPGAFIQLGTLSSIANRLLHSGVNPLNDSRFLNPLRRLSKNTA